MTAYFVFFILRTCEWRATKIDLILFIYLPIQECHLKKLTLKFTIYSQTSIDTLPNYIFLEINEKATKNRKPNN